MRLRSAHPLSRSGTISQETGWGEVSAGLYAQCDAADRQRCALSECPVLLALLRDRAGLPDFDPQF
jgi:hypothetical protein